VRLPARCLFFSAVSLFSSWCCIAHAGGGRVLATGGVTQIEGAAGGGIVPWALIAGYATRDENGATAFYSHLDIKDFALAKRRRCRGDLRSRRNHVRSPEAGSRHDGTR
jgi:hypothetical protein